jgi:hypothetical protein
MLTDAERELLAEHVRSLHKEAAAKAARANGSWTQATANSDALASDLRDLLYRLGGSL